ncbi:MAG TPA: hypothetical protein VD969_26770 [Symbiobacteriaceae bacterium]|nr:hypothetical protein [Symbiobacteriaceae bacterium]
MNKVIALVLVVLGGVLMLKTLSSTWLLLLLLAAAFAWGASTGSIGRWGYSVAVVCVLLAIPGFILRTILGGITLAFGMAVGLLKLLPVLLVLVGIYLLFRAFK